MPQYFARVRWLSAFVCILAAPAPAQQSTTPAPPSLVVLIVVDQMRPDYFDRFASQLTGGLGRLYHNGAVFTSAWQDHAITETAPGHSVMLSGRFPRGTGIITNTLGVPDPKAPLVGGGGPGASPARFRGSSLIDWMQAKDPRSRALSVSRKDRGAILPMGRARESVYWYAADGRFTTSTYYADTVARWVRDFNDRHAPASYAGKQWTLLLPDSAYTEPDTSSWENFGQDAAFPHRFPSDPAQAARLFTEYPAMDSLTAQLALAGVSAMRLGAGPQTDLLSISFSTTDAVGHRYGPDSRELHDQIVRLDRYIGAFIDSLYKLRDSSRIAFAFTSDDGVAPIPEVRAAREHVEARRVEIGPVFDKLDAQLHAAHLDGVRLSFEEGIFAVDRRQLARMRVNADSLVDAVASALRQTDGVLRVDAVKALPRDTLHDAIARRWYHMLPADLQADFVVTLKPYAYYGATSIATHGTPHDYDAQVPLIFYGPAFKPGRYSQRALVADIAPTLAAVIGVKPSERLDGVVRSEAINASRE